MLSWFPMVVVVDGGSKEAVHHVVWGGTANECLRSVSKRTKKLEQNPLQLYPENLTFRTLDHRMVAARVPTSGARGQDQRGEEEACLNDDEGLEQRTRKGRRQKSTPTTTKPATGTDAGTIERGRRDKPVRVAGGGGGIECGAAHKTGQRRHKQDWWGPQTTVAAATWLVDLTRRLVSCCIYTQTGLDGGLIDNTTLSLARPCGGFPPGSKAFAKSTTPVSYNDLLPRSLPAPSASEPPSFDKSPRSAVKRRGLDWTSWERGWRRWYS